MSPCLCSLCGRRQQWGHEGKKKCGLWALMKGWRWIWGFVWVCENILAERQTVMFTVVMEELLPWPSQCLLKCRMFCAKEEEKNVTGNKRQSWTWKHPWVWNSKNVSFDYWTDIGTHYSAVMERFVLEITHNWPYWIKAYMYFFTAVFLFTLFMSNTLNIWKINMVSKSL